MTRELPSRGTNTEIAVAPGDATAVTILAMESESFTIGSATKVDDKVRILVSHGTTLASWGEVGRVDLRPKSESNTAMYAVVQTGGKQYRVQEGQTVKLEKIEAETGSTINFDEILLVANGDDIKIGQPVVKGAKVAAEIRKTGFGDQQKKVGVEKTTESKSELESKSHMSKQANEPDHNSDATYKTKQSKKSVKSNKSGGKSDKSFLQ